MYDKYMKINFNKTHDIYITDSTVSSNIYLYLDINNFK